MFEMPASINMQVFVVVVWVFLVPFLRLLNSLDFFMSWAVTVGSTLVVRITFKLKF